MMTNPIQTVFVELRIALRIIQETLGGLKRSGWMNLVVSITMGSILSIFGLLFLGITQVQDVVKGLGSSLEISVYLEPDADVSNVTDEIRKQPYVSAIELVSKEDALADMRKTYQVPALENNPLPDTLHVNVTDARTIEQAVGTLRQIDGVEEVRYAYDIVERIQSIARFLSFTGLILLVYLGALTVFIISNTIHLLIEARGREIEILRMMGVNNWYIRLPFLLQGATYGLFGSLLGLIPLFYATEYGRMIYEALSLKQHSVSLLSIFVVMFLLGATVGSSGAALSMRRYMRI
jgi:cell division transport system permease protein